ncbi:PAS domain S-box protein [Flavobacterium sp. LT1R49]|uniref:PAS domain S-box protein n=1 Tax=Flavobacterium arabinosi TaxID=3398737 RepID=UPI003A85B291
MKKNPIPENEIKRLKALKEYSIMDSLPEKEYDSITQLASYICETPIALVSLLDEDRQWFKSTVGLEVTETPRNLSFCQYAIMGDEVYEVNNATENETFANNPLVTGNPNIRFYAGAPLKDENGFNLGSLCVIDTEPRILTNEQKNALKLLAHQVVLLLDLRKKNANFIKSQREFQNFIELSKDLVCIANVDSFFYKVNPAFTAVLGYSKEELEGKPFIDFIHPEDLDKTYKEVEKLSNGHKTISFENRYRCKNGNYVLLSWNTSPDPDTGNLYCIARDITLEKQQQEELINIAADLTSILNATEFAIISSDLDGTIKQFNRGAEKLLGYKSEEIVGKTTPSIFHVWDEVVKHTDDLITEFGENLVPGYDTFVLKARELGIADSNEWTYVRKDGSLIPIVLSITAIKNNLGELTGYLGISKDITKEKEAELNLISSNKLLDESQSIAKIGSWKFDLMTNDLIWSKGHYQIFDLEELPSDELFLAYRSKIHPDDLSGLDKALEKILTTGADLHYNHRLLFSNGNLKYVVAIGKPYKNEKGEVVGVQGTIQDITDKTLAEQKIEEKAKEINDIKSALDEAAIVAITDQKGVFSYVNENFCAVSKYSKEELIGQDQQIISTGYHTIEFRRDVFGTIANGNIWKGEVMNRAKDGSFYWENTTIVPFLNEKGKPYQYIAISTDITQEKLAKENLNNALVDLGKKNKELDQYAYIVSHDLKAPLRAINNLSEWIVEDMPEMPDEVSANFELLRGRIQRMENLINGVLEYSRIGRTEIEKETTDLKKMLNQIIDSVVPIEGFEVSMVDTIPVIETERILLQQVFSNLISNSVKYNDKPIGKIECLYEILPDFHQFTIKDNGPGIAEEYHKKVFEVFQTIEARDKKESTGIGLSIVKKIIEEKGGAIYIESENDNGTSFIFTLPK